MICELTPDAALPLFDGWDETMIWSCLEGIMGRIYGDDPLHPSCAAAFIGDFIFFAGIPCEELAAFRPPLDLKDFRIMVPQNKYWENMLLSVYGEQARPIQRYATKKDPHGFDAGRLSCLASRLPEGFQAAPIDEAFFRQCRQETWSADLVSQFPDWEDFSRLGLGVVIHKDGVVVSGASSYTRYRDGIEIQVDTREDFRRRGLAFICAARLILECLDRGLYPSWDAHNRASLALAEKLGYTFSHAYSAVEVRSY